MYDKNVYQSLGYQNRSFLFILLIRYVLSVTKDCNKRVTVEQVFVTNWLQVYDKRCHNWLCIYNYQKHTKEKFGTMLNTVGSKLLYLLCI